MESNIIIPYSHHHRDCAMMIGKPCTQAVFEYLFDEYQARMKAGKPIADIPFSKSKISKARSINRETVGRTLDALEKMKLITINDNYYSLDGKLYMALIKAFSATPYNNRQRFIELLADGCIDELEEFGVSIDGVSEKEIAAMSGSIIETDDFSAGLSKNQQVCIKTDSVVENPSPMSKNQQWCRFFDKYNANFVDFSAVIRENVSDFQQVCRFLCTLTDEELPDSDIQKLAKAITDGKSTLDDEEMQIFLLLGCRFLCRGVTDFRQLGVDFSSPEININNKIKKENSKRSLVKEKEKKEELDSNIPDQDEEDDEPSDFQVDPNMMGDSLLLYQLDKKKKSLPYFPASSIEEFTSDIRNCLDRADKIFINKLWELFHDHFDQDENKDDEGNVICDASTEVDNKAIFKDDFIPDFIRYAREETESIIQNGKVEVDGEQYEVTAQPIDGNDYYLIPGFEIKTLCNGDHYIVSASRVHNIFGEQIKDTPANVKTQRGNEAGREDDYTYMKKIIQIGSDDNLYNQLTPIELAVYNFLCDNFQLDENGEILDVNQSFLPERQFRVFLAEIKQNGITQNEFVEVIFNNKLDEGGISLRNRMFSAQKIRNWNTKHSVTSIVDEYEHQTQE